MKNYVIGTLAVALLATASIMYKNENFPRKWSPVIESGGKGDVEFPLHLYVFLNKNNCTDCLEIVEVLNNLPPHFVVFGLVPEEQLDNETEIRQRTGAAFPLRSAGDFKKHAPWYSPTIVGVSPTTGKVYFTLPGVPGGKAYLESFLESLYSKLYPVFLEENVSKKKGGRP